MSKLMIFLLSFAFFAHPINKVLADDYVSEVDTLINYEHDPEYASEIEEVELQLSRDYHTEFTTSVTRAFWGLNSKDSKAFNPSDKEYLEFLKAFKERAIGKKLKARFAPVNEGKVLISVIDKDYKLYSNDNVPILYRDQRLYVRSDALDELWTMLDDNKGLYPPEKGFYAKSIVKKRNAILKAIAAYMNEIASYDIEVRAYIMIISGIEVPKTVEELAREVSYHHQKLLLQGVVNVLHDLQEGKKVGNGYRVALYEDTWKNRLAYWLGKTVGGVPGVDLKDVYIVGYRNSVGSDAIDKIIESYR